MEVVLEPAKYVVAVSGGVDSVALLRLLQAEPGLELVIAHFDHGIRPDSALDAEFVSQLAARCGLPFITERVELGPQASENTARQARYAFLQRVRREQQAVAIVTAHHQDDVLETAIHNLRRGTGRRGLSSLQSTTVLKRPLLGYAKQELIDYALKQNLSWREDTTNHDERYTRNYIRRRLLSRFNADARQRLLALIDRMAIINQELDQLLTRQLTQYAAGHQLNRDWFTGLPYADSKEVLAFWLRQQGIADYDRQTLERLVWLINSKPTGKTFDVKHGYRLRLTKAMIIFELATAPTPVYTK